MGNPGQWFNQIAESLVYNPDQPLFFTRFFFWVFLAFVFAGYSLIFRKPPVRNAYLLLVSLYFYYKSAGLFFLVMVVSVVINYLIGVAIGNSTNPRKKKLLLLMSVATCLGVLIYFKYTHFFAQFITSITGASLDPGNIVLPVGVSFFTFQILSYTIDVYRGDVEAVRNPLDFGFYVSFFPQLVAGPIVRAAAFIPQLYQEFRLTKREVWHAAFLILAGLVKKMVFSDTLAVALVDPVFDNPGGFPGFENALAVYGYALQIYFDFSGYTDIAIGVALLLGFKLPVNFNSPYKAESIRDFWKRWHISLSTWLRDYLYKPLGGNRKGEWVAIFAVLVTMILGGLWHGAGWNFVWWGAYHGILVVFSRLLNLIPGFKNLVQQIPGLLKMAFTFHLVLIGWLLFRNHEPDGARLMVSQIFTAFQGSVFNQWLGEYYLILALLLGGFILSGLSYSFKERIRGWFILSPYWLKLSVILICLLLIRQIQVTDLQPFIYFQF